MLSAGFESVLESSAWLKIENSVPAGLLMRCVDVCWDYSYFYVRLKVSSGKSTGYSLVERAAIERFDCCLYWRLLLGGMPI